MKKEFLMMCMMGIFAYFYQVPFSLKLQLWTWAAAIMCVIIADWSYSSEEKSLEEEKKLEKEKELEDEKSSQEESMSKQKYDAEEDEREAKSIKMLNSIKKREGQEMWYELKKQAKKSVGQKQIKKMTQMKKMEE